MGKMTKPTNLRSKVNAILSDGTKATNCTAFYLRWESGKHPHVVEWEYAEGCK
jgi:hypothetical protein